MRRTTRLAALAVLAATLVALAVTTSGCGSGGGSSSAKPSQSASPRWTTVLTKDISGAQPVKLNLGTWALGNGARLGWELSGPATKPSVELTFRIINTANGVGYGNATSSSDAGFSTSNENAIVLAPIWPGKYVVFFSQRFQKARGPGYDGKLTVSTFTYEK
jgi:hypothetical protein